MTPSATPGSPSASTVVTHVIAGLTVTIDGVDLRDIRWNGTEVFRRVYPVFQDLNWTNRPLSIDERVIERSDAGLIMTASGTGSFDATPLRWTVDARIGGDAIDYRFRATADQPFMRNRLGLCLLHPMAAAGAPCLVSHADGTTTSGHLPTEISPHQPFLDMTAISHQVGGEAWVGASFEGDLFEMEDHRNWSDASFKTYCTPINLPFPVTVMPGDVIDQTVHLTFPVGTRTDEPAARPGVTITVGDEVIPLPRIGLGLTPDDLDWDEVDIRRVRALTLDHCRVTVDSRDPGAVETVTAASSLAQRIDADLHVAVTCEDPDQLSVFRDLTTPTAARISRWYVISADHKVTPESWSGPARDALATSAADAEIAGGTDHYFTELNREPPGTSSFDVVNFSLTPQVHAFDDRTLIQNCAAQAVIARDAPQVCGGTRVSVSPITLRPRFNPNATDPARDVSSSALPSDVDSRQRTWFAACWTAMSVKHLSEPGTLDSVTYFETPGWKGVLAGTRPSPDPDAFPASPGEAYPVVDLLDAMVGASAVRPCTSSDPELVDALILAGPMGTRVITANWTSDAHQIVFAGAISALVKAAPQSITVVDLPHVERTP